MSAWVINGHVGLHEKASALPLKADMLGAAEIVSYVPIADIVRHRRRPYSAKYRFADINAVRPRNGLQVIHRPGALVKQGSEFVICNTALYPCSFFSTTKLNTRSVTGQIATQIPNRSA
jgi:hypothetical protein